MGCVSFANARKFSNVCRVLGEDMNMVFDVICVYILIVVCFKFVMFVNFVYVILFLFLFVVFFRFRRVMRRFSSFFRAFFIVFVFVFCVVYVVFNFLFIYFIIFVVMFVCVNFFNLFIFCCANAFGSFSNIVGYDVASNVLYIVFFFV